MKQAVENPKCGSKTKSGGFCKNPAGFKTNHPGEGRCHLHGGNSAIKHGRYSKLSNPLGIKIQEHMQDTDPLDMTAELSSLKAMLEIWMDKNGEESMVAQAMSGAIPLIDGIRKTVDTIHKMQTRELLTSREMEMSILELTRIIAEEVKDSDTISRIATRLSTAFDVRAEVAARIIEGD